MFVREVVGACIIRSNATAVDVDSFARKIAAKMTMESQRGSGG
jgi:extradiol dioxygenase family protein